MKEWLKNKDLIHNYINKENYDELEKILSIDLKYNKNKLENSENILFIIVREYLKKDFLIPYIKVKLKNYDEGFYINYLFNSEVNDNLKNIDKEPIWKEKIYKVFDNIYINFIEYLKIEMVKNIIKFKNIIREDIKVEDDTNILMFDKLFRIKYESIIVEEYCRNFISEINNYIKSNREIVNIAIYKNQNPDDIFELNIKRIIINYNNSINIATNKNPLILEFENNIEKIIKKGDKIELVNSELNNIFSNTYNISKYEIILDVINVYNNKISVTSNNLKGKNLYNNSIKFDEIYDLIINDSKLIKDIYIEENKLVFNYNNMNYS